MTRLLGVLCLLAACYRSHGGGDEGVACPDAPCAVGNACEVCESERRCVTLDLPPLAGCRTVLCDGDEDCDAGSRCDVDDPSYVSCVRD